jgi:hypothetical protein
LISFCRLLHTHTHTLSLPLLLSRNYICSYVSSGKANRK